MTDYAGIDYSLGQSNFDKKTGIHYGVIQLDSLSEWAIEDFEADYGDPHCPECGGDVKSVDDASLPDTEDWEQARHECEEYACESCKYVFGSESAFPEEAVEYVLDKDGYVASLDGYNDVFILKSPYYTHAQFCSPCAPGAGHLDNPCAAGPKTFCFGHDWFEGSWAPYPVYSVATGELVVPGE